jgi:lipopolysaccharide export system permease protein
LRFLVVVLVVSYLYAKVLLIIGKSRQKSQKFPAVMIFRRSLIRELTATTIGLFLVLLAILFTNLVLRILARAAGGGVAPEGVLPLLGFATLFYLNILLSVALFLTVLLTLSRWYRDSEMIVWFTSGQSLTACLQPIILFAAPFLVAIVLLSLYLSPWAEQRRLEYERQLESRDEIVLITPGLFREFPRANLVAFVESINPFDSTIRNVFLHSVDADVDATTVAARGRLEEAPNGDRFIVLESGRRYEGKPGTPEYRVIEFEKLGRRIEPAELRELPISTKAMPTGALAFIDGRVERAELFWRISVPVSALVLTLIAIPLSYVNPRVGRSANLVAAAFLYMLYSNCLNIVQSLIAQGKLDFWAGLVLPHVIALLVVVILFRHQLSVTGLFGRAPRASPATASAG